MKPNIIDLHDMAGRTALVTGANSGMGIVITRELTRAGAKVIMLCRDPIRGERARKMVLDNLDATHPPILWTADLTDPASIRETTNRFQKDFDRLDVLVNLAGGMFTSRSLTVDGLEMTFALNVLAPARLVHGIRPSLEQAPSARVINFSSDAHRFAELDVKSLPVALPYRPFPTYARNKLALILWGRRIAPELSRSGITINALHPGFVRSTFSGVTGVSGAIFRFAGRMFALTPEAGAATALKLAGSPAVEGETGGYWSKMERVAPSEAAQNEDTADRVLELINGLL